MGSIRDFVIERPLGSGGMAAVHLARQAGTGAPVALKVIHPHLAGDAQFVQRFVREIKASAGLVHANIVRTVAAGQDQGVYFIAAEYVDGGTVSCLLAAAKRVPSVVAAALGVQLLSGLAHAHAAGVVHRDVKPDNLLLTSSGILKIADFGIAKTQGTGLTATGAIIGTPAYMSPEQAMGWATDARSDLFSAGIVLYELLTGVNPFVADTPVQSMNKVANSVAPPAAELAPEVPRALERIVERLLEREPARRHQSAAEAAGELKEWLASEGGTSLKQLAAYLADPVGVGRALRIGEAKRCLERAEPLLGGAPADRNRAVLELHRATSLAPQLPEMSARLQQVCTDMQLGFGPPQNPKIAELEAQAARPGNPVGAYVQLASLYRLEGNLFKSALCFRKALRLRPGDGYLQGQLAAITGDRADAAPRGGAGAAIAAPADRLHSFSSAVELHTGRTAHGAAASAPETANTVLSGTGARVPSFSSAVELHTGRTGAQPAPAPADVAQTLISGASAARASSRTALPTTLQPATVAESAPAAPNAILSIVGAFLGNKLVWAGAVVVALVLGVRWASRRIDVASEEQGKQLDLMYKAQEAKARQMIGGALSAQAEAPERRYGSAGRELESARQLIASGGAAQAAERLAAFIASHADGELGAEAKLMRAEALVAAGNAGGAVAQIEAFAAEHPGHPRMTEAEALRIEALRAVGRFSEAVTAADRFIAAAGGSEHERRVRLARARCNLELGDRAAARRDAEAIRDSSAPTEPMYREARLILTVLGDPPPAQPTRAGGEALTPVIPGLDE